MQKIAIWHGAASVGVTKKPENQPYQGLASPNMAITPTIPCKVGTLQISTLFL
jgi:hypothetical protein